MNNNYNEISDLGLAASLTSLGFVILRISRTNPRRVVFVFQQSTDLKDSVDLYWTNELLLPASLLLENVRQLKSRIYSQDSS